MKKQSSRAGNFTLILYLSGTDNFSHVLAPYRGGMDFLTREGRGGGEGARKIRNKRNGIAGNRQRWSPGIRGETLRSRCESPHYKNIFGPRGERVPGGRVRSRGQGESLPFRVRARRSAVCGDRGRRRRSNTYCTHTHTHTWHVHVRFRFLRKDSFPPFSPFSLFYICPYHSRGIRDAALSLPRYPRLAPPVNKLRSRTFSVSPPLFTWRAAAAARTPRRGCGGCFFPRDGPPNFSRISCGAIPNGSRRKFAGPAYFVITSPGL